MGRVIKELEQDVLRPTRGTLQVENGTKLAFPYPKIVSISLKCPGNEEGKEILRLRYPCVIPNQCQIIVVQHASGVHVINSHLCSW